MRHRPKFIITFIVAVIFIYNITIMRNVTRTNKKKFISFEFLGKNGLNHHMWLNVCCSSVDALCNTPLFPKAPNTRSIINGTGFSWPGNEMFAERIFGFLLPPRTGSYVFAISSDDSSQLWLSSDEKSENSVLIANVGEKHDNCWTTKYDYWKYSTQISTEIELVADQKYFIDILHVQIGSDNHLMVQWKHSLSKNFSDIDVKYLSAYLTEDFVIKTFSYDISIPEAKSCKNLTKENPFLLQSHLTYAEHDVFGKVLPNFENKTFRNKRRNITTLYEALYKHFQQTSAYPDETKIAKHISTPYKITKMSQKEAIEIANIFVTNLDTLCNGTYLIKSLINIEKTKFMNGSRYLLELDLLKKKTNQTIHLSEYIYQDKSDTKKLYYVEHMQWKRNALITFVITAKNQGAWIQIFLDDLAAMMRQTRDHNVNIIVFDYESQDIDLQKAILTRGIGHRVKTLSKAGRYSRRESFNLAVELVEDPHSIVFLVDLHLTFGEALLNDIRKHTIEGQLVYTPIIIRQWECSTPNNKYQGYYGFYEMQGFGMVAMYKSDWDRVGGFTMNDKNKHNWGGEDYELIDGIYSCGLDYVRVKCPYVYHYKHTKKSMWV